MREPMNLQKVPSDMILGFAELSKHSDSDIEAYLKREDPLTPNARSSAESYLNFQQTKRVSEKMFEVTLDMSKATKKIAILTWVIAGLTAVNTLFVIYSAFLKK